MLTPLNRTRPEPVFDLPWPRTAAAGGRRHQCLYGAPGPRYRFRALYLSGGGVAANSLGIPTSHQHHGRCADGCSRITDVVDLPLLVDIDTGWGGAFNIARTIRSMIKAGSAAVHIEDR